MKKSWNVRGIRTGLARGAKASGAESPKDSVFRLGIQVPVISKFFARRAISSREKSIDKIAKWLKSAVASEEAKINKTVQEAMKTNAHDIITRAGRLYDRLKEASCVEPKIAEEVPGVPEKPEKAPKVEPLNIVCIRAIAKGVFGKDETTGMVRGKGSEQRFKREDLNIYLEKCVQNGGKVKITGAVMDVLTDGAKTSDVEIDAGIQ